jgi:V/A-type H+-transporting ATPase subunit F
MAVIGDKNSIFAFKAVGVEVFGADTETEAKEIVKTLAKENYKVIFITEDLAEKLEEFLNRYRTKTYPAIIPIPKGGTTSGYAMNSLRRDMDKAIGADILFKDKK